MLKVNLTVLDSFAALQDVMCCRWVFQHLSRILTKAGRVFHVSSTFFGVQKLIVVTKCRHFSQFRVTRYSDTTKNSSGSLSVVEFCRKIKRKHHTSKQSLNNFRAVKETKELMPVQSKN